MAGTMEAEILARMLKVQIIQFDLKMHIRLCRGPEADESRRSQRTQFQAKLLVFLHSTDNRGFLEVLKKEVTQR